MCIHICIYIYEYINFWITTVCVFCYFIFLFFWLPSSHTNPESRCSWNQYEYPNASSRNADARLHTVSMNTRVHTHQFVNTRVHTHALLYTQKVDIGLHTVIMNTSVRTNHSWRTGIQHATNKKHHIIHMHISWKFHVMNMRMSCRVCMEYVSFIYAKKLIRSCIYLVNTKSHFEHVHFEVIYGRDSWIAMTYSFYAGIHTCGMPHSCVWWDSCIHLCKIWTHMSHHVQLLCAVK